MGNWYEEEVEFGIVLLCVREELLKSVSPGCGHFRGEPLEVPTHLQPLTVAAIAPGRQFSFVAVKSDEK